jgi:hypothetical protein
MNIVEIRSGGTGNSNVVICSVGIVGPSVEISPVVPEILLPSFTEEITSGWEEISVKWENIRVS